MTSTRTTVALPCPVAGYGTCVTSCTRGATIVGWPAGWAQATAVDASRTPSTPRAWEIRFTKAERSEKGGSEGQRQSRAAEAGPHDGAPRRRWCRPARRVEDEQGAAREEGREADACRNARAHTKVVPRRYGVIALLR